LKPYRIEPIRTIFYIAVRAQPSPASAEEAELAKHKLWIAAAAIALLGGVLFATQNADAAVEGGGWIPDNPSFKLQQAGCGHISGMTFQLTCGNKRGQQRAERRYATYNGGTHQFEGFFKITSMGGSRISLKQSFKTSGPFFLLGVERGGRLYAVNDGKTIATGATVGTTVRVNTVHVVGNQLRVYINGSLRYTTRSPGGSFYDKFGAYRTASGAGPITVEWSGIQFWHK
jgi:hypothetical protein